MTLAKKKRIRAKQIKTNKGKYLGMSSAQIEGALERVYVQVKKMWAKKGFNF